jgi:hypothetical protein
VDALVLRGDEGRESCEKPGLGAINRLTLGSPNGATHHIMVLACVMHAKANPTN